MPWGTLNVRLPLGWRLSQMEGLKSFTLFGGPTRFSLLGGWGESLPHWPKIYSSLPHQEVPPSDSPPTFYSSHQRFIPPTKWQFFMLSPNKNFIFSCIHCSCTIFILPSNSLHTLVMLILVFTSVQYLQNVVFNFEKVWVVTISPCQNSAIR